MNTTLEAKLPLKIWQLTDNGKNITISIWPDRKVRTGYFEKDFWTTLQRNTVPNLTNDEWKASPGPDWKDITPDYEPQYKISLKSALSDLSNDNYEKVRSSMIALFGYNRFREIQNEIFKEIGTIKFEKESEAIS